MTFFIFLLTHYALSLLVPIGIVVIGFKVAAKQERTSNLKLGLGTLLLPPAALVATYYAASTTGCSGGDCTGPMILFGLAAVPVAAVALFGLAVLAQTTLSYAIASIRR